MGQAPDSDFEPAPFSRVADSGRHDELTSTTRCGEGEGDPDMSLQSIATLDSFLLHTGGGDGSSLKDTLRSPALWRLIQLSS
jgi:hypothetical protein